ncbi:MULTISPECIES: 1-(5-phosphoribosyl)-5-[(5-phosphoribosylamino)methylideneamino]imidazole-4-carboxamide isomerase [unclassified Siphonobacter]|uniref:1-(5-phosphoribosyl)-5-[(5- phosphoribosylamino)methylideneamino]imidazole-4- carboxamide isomerase n=1 Tax=unclassified Siphonobacter TaxID=2635712 RepID=UPI000CC54AEA|nr:MULTISPECIES: 1-(5-phosphoribosyl)-5-[(5-phosphoribosylamino)methylideneamino]imidazole-4-carboxamide isomerase [unclassified Siphonobacter]MDQ1086737.1 phosphoribosylformimino-5-aminoimidazole carboxamide ribotide isomerase [Siphonobacter sp. SORGH_AS_1065]PKK36241.1 1-(5-phosphoribosyl)-5-[(5-phosphoribosylamino)methylideneamino]imidazole-4-carboxamide isomerase [Siphonobacter sp. SORGH_AS_0500]
MYIIPAIDLIEGKAVRLTQGDYSQKTIYNANPLEVAKEFEGAGLTRLHLVDLDGAKAKKVINYKVLERIASQTSLHVDFGGGVQSDEDLKIVFESGARQVTGGSIAVKNPDLFESWLSRFGGEKMILGADAKNERIAVSGWEEGTELWVYDFVKNWEEKGIQYIISTDVAKDGLLQGPSFDLYKKLQEQSPELKIIASGGVSSMDDLTKLADMNVYGVIVGKAIYEGRVTLSDLRTFA